MSAPLIWIFLPAAASVLLHIFRKFDILVLIIGVFIGINLTLAAWIIPIDEPVIVGSTSYSIDPSFNISSFNLDISNSQRSIIIQIFGISVFFMSGAGAARIQGKFIPYCLMADAVIIAAISFKPIIYGVVFFLPLILLSVLILSPPGIKVNSGVIRFLIFQIIGISSISIFGGIISRQPDFFNDPQSVKSGVLLLGIGFLFLYSIFPLYSWIIKVVDSSETYISVFVFFVIFGGYFLYFSTLIQNFNWLFEVANILEIIRFLGMIMVISGGIWAALERNLRRILGYAIVIEAGYGLICMSIQFSGMQYVMLFSLVLSLAVWALGLSVLNTGITRDTSVQGLGRLRPFAALAIISANLSLAGVPLFAGFPVMLTLWNEVALESPSTAFLIFFGSIGLMVGGLRSLMTLMITNDNSEWDGQENWIQRIFLLVGVCALLIFGIFPHLMYSTVFGLLSF